jgi:hypothetical protein
MKNNFLKFLSVFAIFLGVVMALVLIFSAFTNEKPQEIEPKPKQIEEEKEFKKPKLDDITPVYTKNPTKEPQKQENNDYNFNELNSELDEIYKKLLDLKEESERIKEEPAPIINQIQTPPPQVIIQTQYIPIQTAPPVVETKPVEEPVNEEPKIMSKKSIDLISKIGKNYIAYDWDKFDSTPLPRPEGFIEPTESNYINLKFVVRNDDGVSVRNAEAVISATDNSQNKTVNGTGNLGKIFKEDGSEESVYYYPFQYKFRQGGDHNITFQANGMIKHVKIEGVVEPS